VHIFYTLVIGVKAMQMRWVRHHNLFLTFFL
jgi:hypothetical protein